MKLKYERDGIMAKNLVIAGDYAGKQVVGGGMAQPGISLGLIKQLYLNKTTVETYEVLTDEHRKSAASGIARGLVGGFLLGGVGMIAGGLSAKENGTYQVAVQFKDGKKSLLEIDDKIYKSLAKCCF